MRVLEVLVIEDNAADIRLLQEGFNRSCSHLQLNVRIAQDGGEALRMLLQDAYHPDMILLDLAVPKIDGKSILNRIRSDSVALNSAPIVVFSSGPHDIQEAVDQGANAYIVKPLGLVEYLKAIERFAILWMKPHADAANN